MHVKICGVTNLEDADEAVAVGASAIGINLVPSSPRAVDLSLAQQLVAHIADRALTVLVVADLDVTTMRSLLQATGARCLQLHGDEDHMSLSPLLPHAYKAIRVGGSDEVQRALAYPGEHLLVDAKVAGALGGTGHCVDWDLVAPLARVRKLTLAGGLTAGNVGEAINRVAPFCVDVASGVELTGQPRRKDRAKLRAFAAAVANAAPSRETRARWLRGDGRAT